MDSETTGEASIIPPGIRSHRLQFGLLVLVNAFVGGMVGLERTILPLIAEADFGIASKTAAVAFIATFGVSKAVINLFAGRIADRVGRRKVLLVGWLIGMPVPIMLILADSWTVVLLANVLLGVNQALTWTMTVVMKVDIAQPTERGLALGLNEFAGYAGVALVAALTGSIAAEYGLRPEPFFVGFGLAAAGLGISLVLKDTQRADTNGVQRSEVRRAFGSVFHEVSWKNPVLAISSLAGLVTNMKDGMLWGLLPVYLLAAGMTISEIGILVASYPASWAITQLIFGPLSDRVGRKPLIVLGLIVQGCGLFALTLAGSFEDFLVLAVAVGIGTAMVYPTLQAQVSDVTSPDWRASALGVYRFWRDSGYAIGALSAGFIADMFGMSTSIVAVAFLVLVSALVMSRVNSLASTATH